MVFNYSIIHDIFEETKFNNLKKYNLIQKLICKQSVLKIKKNDQIQRIYKKNINKN